MEKKTTYKSKPEPYLCKKLQRKDPNWSKWPFVAQFSRIYSERKSRRIVHLNQKVVFDRLESNRSASAIVEEVQAIHNKTTYNRANFVLRWQREQHLKFFHRKNNKNTMHLEHLIIWGKKVLSVTLVKVPGKESEPHVQKKGRHTNSNSSNGSSSAWFSRFYREQSRKKLASNSQKVGDRTMTVPWAFAEVRQLRVLHSVGKFWRKKS